MKLRNIFLALAAVVSLAAGSVLPAAATPIIGSIGVGGNDTIDTSNLTTNTQFTFTSSFAVPASASGDFTLFNLPGTTVTMDTSIWTFSPPPGSLLFTITNGADSIQFSLTGFASAITRSGNDSSSTFGVTLLGNLINGTGFFATLDPSTAASAAFTANNSGATRTFSITLTAPPSTTVPEPASLALLGFGLLAAGAAGRRKLKAKQV